MESGSLRGEGCGGAQVRCASAQRLLVALAVVVGAQMQVAFAQHSLPHGLAALLASCIVVLANQQGVVGQVFVGRH
ncbi:MAG TPA: hypothetical protein PLX86_07485, partial [Acidovorax defluvii]|nr:hypothetical protein [Acidovorax defluvii]